MKDHRSIAQTRGRNAIPAGLVLILGFCIWPPLAFAEEAQDAPTAEAEKAFKSSSLYLERRTELRELKEENPELFLERLKALRSEARARRRGTTCSSPTRPP